MKKLLLFTCMISFIAIASCSREEESTEVSFTEKEDLVKKSLIEFNKSVVQTSGYNNFISSISQKSNNKQLTQDELEILIKDFLVFQNQNFTELYYKIIALDITPEEFRSIAHQFEYLKLKTISSINKQGGCCGLGGGTAGDHVIFAFLDWACC